MQKFIEVTGKNEEDAIARALAQLGMDRDDVSVEILERARSGFLGIGSVPARIKVTYEAPDEEPAPVPAAQPVREEKPAAPERPVKAEKPAAPDKPAKAEKPAKTEKPARAEKPVKAEKAANAEKPAPAPVEDGDEVAARISAFLSGLFAHMEVEAVPVITRQEDIYSVVLQGEELGALIGRRGETLDAIQQLTGYAVNHGRSRRFRIHVDAENYRARREESLERLARKVAGKVVKYRRSVTLEPMNAYERHVIHTALQNYPGVSTHSTGTEPNRRTVVSYDPAKR